MIQFHVMLAVLCVAVAASGYLGWLSGIHSKRHASFMRGFRAGQRYMRNEIFTIKREYHNVR